MDRKTVAEQVGKRLSEIDQRLMALLGLELVSMETGKSVCQMAVREDMVNSHGYCQGGLVFTLADQAFAYACMSGNQAGVTLSANVIYSSPARLGDQLTAVAEVRSESNRTATCNVTVTNQDGNIVAHYQGVNYRTKGQII